MEAGDWGRSVRTRAMFGVMAESDSEGAKTKLVTNQPYDESLDVNDSEEVASIYTPSPRQPAGLRSNRSQTRLMADNSSDEYEDENSKITSTEEKKKGSKAMQQGFVENEDEEEDEDSDDTESDDDDEEHGAPPEGAYDPADYEHLPTSNEIKELFQYITRYTPQSIELDHKLKPFIPDFIPSVGDIDAFLKVPRPDGKPDNLGLIPLDEPCAKQSDPTVLSLWLTENSKQHSITQLKVKSLENAEKNPKALDNWMDSISELHHSKPPANVHYTKPMPDIEALMQEWPPEFEELLGKVSLPTAEVNCELTQYIDMICAILDIPIYKDRIQSLHVLFTLYSEFKNSQHFKALAEGNKVSSCEEPPSHSAEVDTVTFD
ncbi:intraflagellar transport protein 46 homolog isoform X2 [Rhincodon typus]|uniref:intraflagellar transport protein 46 homolog isoform X2 n=1 Tax=Rhincodon typus TaxID=259920 RepID=UPI00203021EB|nr:intraflagellar transport protein 46 homolog isoform X2 [Rhincodon typus]